MKQVLDFETAIHQNEAKATEAIWEAKAHCGTAIRKAETHHVTTIRKVEAHCATAITEAEGHNATDIREAESHCADYAHTIQQSHSNNMQCLEKEALEEEGKDHQSSLAPCGMALQVPHRSPRGTNVPPLVTDREHVSGHSPGHSPTGI